MFLKALGALASLIYSVDVLSNFGKKTHAPARLRNAWRAARCEGRHPCAALRSGYDALVAEPDWIRDGGLLARVGAPAAGAASLACAAAALASRREGYLALLAEESGPDVADAALARRAAREVVRDGSAPVRVRAADRATWREARRSARREGLPVVDVHAPLYAGRGRRVLLIGPARRATLPGAVGKRVGHARHGAPR